MIPARAKKNRRLLEGHIINNILHYYMKVILAVIILGFLAIFYFDLLQRESPKEVERVAEVFEKSTSTNFSMSGFTVTGFTLNPNSFVNLISNFENKISSTEILEKEKCSYLVNGGFYGEENVPIGLFKTADGYLSEFKNNRLFNGLVVSFENGKLDILEKIDNREISFGFQTGPVLFRGGEKVNLDLPVDKKARRIVFVQTLDGKDLFLAFYDPQSFFSGPTLVDLPSLIEKYEDEFGLEITDAINLDGGTASVYFDGETHLKELKPVGSFLCIN